MSNQNGVGGLHLPLIDAQKLKSGDRKEVERLRRAAHKVGFWYIVNHGMSTEELEAVRGLAKTFFAMPQDEKESLHLSKSPHYRGYTRVGEEVTLGIEDFKEVIDLGPQSPPSHSPVDPNGWRRLQGPNLWPELPGWKDDTLQYMNRMSDVGHIVVRALALAMGKEEGHFDEHFTEPHTLLRMLRYPPQAAGGEQKIGVGAHTDYGALTFILQDDVGGLQVKGRDGEWWDAPPVPDSFIVNLGDTMQVWTSGYFLATPHRVVQPSCDRSRYSIAFFFEPNLDAMIVPFEFTPQHMEANESEPDTPEATPLTNKSDNSFNDGEIQTIESHDPFVYGQHLLNAFQRAYPNTPTSPL